MPIYSVLYSVFDPKFFQLLNWNMNLDRIRTQQILYGSGSSKMPGSGFVKTISETLVLTNFQIFCVFVPVLTVGDP